MTTGTIPPPLAATDMDAVCDGIAVASLGEDGDLIALGHHDNPEAAFSAYIHEVIGEDPSEYDFSAGFQHRWAVRMTADECKENGYDGWGVKWGEDTGESFSAATPGAFPVTVWNPVTAEMPDTAMPPTREDKETPVIYSENRQEFRRELVRVANQYGQTSLGYRAGDDNEAASDAHQGNLMAGCYAYTLAAAVAIDAKAHGDKAADELACEVESILINGDDAEWNADVEPAEQAGQATP